MSGQQLPTPELTFAFGIEVQVRLPLTVGDTGSGFRRIFPIMGGRVFGPRLSGQVLPVGADWSLVRPDGVAEIYARYAVRTDDGHVVDVVNAGLMHGLPGRDPVDGEPVEEPDIFCRTTPRFEASAPSLRWLNEEVFVGTYGPGTDAADEGDFTVKVEFHTVR